MLLLGTDHEVEAMRKGQHRGDRVFGDRRRVDSTRSRHRNARRLQRSHRMIGARAEELHPLQIRRALFQILGHDESQHRIAPIGDELADLVRGAAGPIGDLGIRNGGAKQVAMGFGEGDGGNDLHGSHARNFALHLAGIKRKEFALSKAGLGPMIAEGFGWFFDLH